VLTSLPLLRPAARRGGGSWAMLVPLPLPVRQSWFSFFKMVEISLSDKSPDRLSTEERSGKSTFQPAL
jgi:hypothetical protein